MQTEQTRTSNDSFSYKTALQHLLGMPGDEHQHISYPRALPPVGLLSEAWAVPEIADAFDMTVAADRMVTGPAIPQPDIHEPIESDRIFTAAPLRSPKSAGPTPAAPLLSRGGVAARQGKSCEATLARADGVVLIKKMISLTSTTPAAATASAFPSSIEASRYRARASRAEEGSFAVNTGLPSRRTTEAIEAPDVRPNIEHLQRTVRVLTAKVSSSSARPREETPSQQVVPPPVLKRVIVRQSSTRSRPSRAFWERSYLRTFR
jgi:hypothetical protein